MIRLNVMRYLASELHALSKEFQKSQKEYLKRLKGQEEIGQRFFTDEQTSQPLSLEDAAERGLSDHQVQELKELERRATDREKEILHIAQSINDLAAIFRELNVLVIEQGTILDRIDYNVEQTLVKVKEGVTQLKIADEYSKKARTLKCIIALIILIIILVGILIWKNKKN